jgi:hypothetical protein
MTRLGGVLVVAALVTVGCSSPEKPRPLAAPDQSMQELETIIGQRVDSGRSQGIVAGMVFPDRQPASCRLRRRNGRLERVRNRLDHQDLHRHPSVGHGPAGRGAPVVGLLPAGVSVPSLKGRQVTLEDLATHASGLPRNPSNLDSLDPDNPYADFTADQLYKFLGGYTLTRYPGSKWEYSTSASACSATPWRYGRA